ncbi:MAG TPA: two-component regulator propeller domain-containing protein [Blastocatellia bacterium]|nr:two-component regulator propeller domain-containing protein [Blastocatellia bacterium]
MFTQPAARRLLVQLRARPLPGRRALICLTCFIVMVALIGVRWAGRRAIHQLESARGTLGQLNHVAFEKEIRSPVLHGGVRLIQSSRGARALARFRYSYFVATDGGLVELSPSGDVVRRYSVHDGLPESELVSLAGFGDQLFIGTKTQGLAAFDGAHFTRYRWPDRQTQAVTTLLADQGDLLIGTFAGGLLSFDGRRFTEITGAEGKRLAAINCLIKDGPRLYVGTFADGLWLREAGRWLHFTTSDGLPSNRITGVVTSDGQVFVATDFGLAVARAEELITEPGPTSPSRFRTLATLPSLSGVAAYGGRVFACKDDGELFQFSASPASGRQNPVRDVAWDRPRSLSGCRLTVMDQALWLLGDEGLWRTAEDEMSAPPATHLALSRFIRPDDALTPASNIISALAVDGDGRLWAGSFRNGIDLFSPAGRHLAHLESDAAREINYLLWQAEAGRMLAATSGGVLMFDALLRSQRLAKADGLLSDSVSHISLIPSSLPVKGQGSGQPRHASMLFATSRGLSLGEPGRLRGLTTVQGLPSNNLYAVTPWGESIYAGTLSGLARIEAGHIVRTFKDSNSKLTHNWVTSLCAVGRRLFIGTYGGGVFELNPAGELYSFAPEIGRVVVNPNAIFSDGERVYVGTLDGAWVLELRSQKWVHLQAELPSSVVLSITGDGRQVYFATTSGIAAAETGWLKSMMGK